MFKLWIQGSCANKKRWTRFERNRSAGYYPLLPFTTLYLDLASFLVRPAADCHIRLDSRQVSTLTHLIKGGRKNSLAVERNLPSWGGPSHLAAAACSFSFSADGPDRCLRDLLTCLATRWNEVEKAIFLRALASSPIITVFNAARLLCLDEIDPLIVLSPCIRDVVRIFKNRQDKAKHFLSFYAKAYELSLDDRLELAQRQAFYHPQQQAHYLKVLSDKTLKSVMMELCRLYGWQLPLVLRHEETPTILPLRIPRTSR